MMNMKDEPNTLEALGRLSGKQLSELHDMGTCPDVSQLRGRVNGAVLGRSVLAKLGVWRGKVFVPSDSVGQVQGFNRLGFACFEMHRFGFSGSITESVFKPRKVLFLDHDREGNPTWVRAYHDEVVAISDDLYLGLSHKWADKKLVFAGFFALQVGR